MEDFWFVVPNNQAELVKYDVVTTKEVHIWFFIIFLLRNENFIIHKQKNQN